MADTVATQTILDGERTVTMKFTNLSDGTGESAVLKVDVSTLNVSEKTRWVVETVDIKRMWYTTSGMAVDILFDANVDHVAWTVSGDGYADFRSMGGLHVDPDITGITGDIKFTTVGHTSGDRYTIMLEMEKNYLNPTLTS